MSNTAETLVKIPLSQGKHAVIDEADYAAVSKMKWCVQVTPGGYCYAVTTVFENKKAKRLHMHRWLLGETNRKRDVHHLNNDGLDNRRANLQSLDRAAHRATMKPKERGVTGYIGVVRFKSTGRYRASVYVNKKMIWSGDYANAHHAATERDFHALRIRGPSVELNFPASPAFQR